VPTSSVDRHHSAEYLRFGDSSIGLCCLVTMNYKRCLISPINLSDYPVDHDGSRTAAAQDDFTHGQGTHSKRFDEKDISVAHQRAHAGTRRPETQRFPSPKKLTTQLREGNHPTLKVLNFHWLSVNKFQRVTEFTFDTDGRKILSGLLPTTSVSTFAVSGP